MASSTEPWSHPTTAPRGFTLIEMLTVVAIIAILATLLLPAIQSTRETARSAYCQRNLLQLGLALGNYASTHGVFPPGVVNDRGPISSLPRGYHMGWAVQILPFIEQTNTYRHIDFRRGVYDDANTTALGTRYKLFLCPSSPLSGTMFYAGCHNDIEAPIDVDNHGVLYLNSHVGYDDIADGPAYTILLGEHRGSAVFGWAAGTRDTLRNTGTAINAIDPTTWGRAKPSLTAGELESLIGEGMIPLVGVGGFSSWHGDGANFLLCDGSVRFLKATIDLGVYRHLGHRADGEVISGAQY